MKILYFFYFCGSFLPSWIRIHNLNADPDPAAQINADPDSDPDPKPWSFVRGSLITVSFCEGGNPGWSCAGDRKTWKEVRETPGWPSRYSYFTLLGFRDPHITVRCRTVPTRYMFQIVVPVHHLLQSTGTLRDKNIVSQIKRKFQKKVNIL